MGIGRYGSGVFTLVVSLRHDADIARIDEWRASFQRASQSLFDATVGQHRLGRIFVANRSMGSAEADCWLMETDGASSSSHGFAVPGEHSTLMADERFRPFIILHEFAHYAYDVFDEYAGDAGAAECIGGTTANACIMEVGFAQGDRFGATGQGGALVEGRVKHFCVASNHDPDGDTRQDARRGQSCWESMVGRFPDLTMPSAPPPTNSPGNVPAIDWVVLQPEQRFVLVVDRSGSMAGAKLREAKSGSHWWVDNAVLGDVLGSVSYASSSSVDHALLPLAADADRQAHRAIIDAWAAGGQTAIGAALRTAHDEFVGVGPRAATQVALLLTDGLQTTGEAVASVIPDLVDAGVRVYAIGVGPAIDEPLLSEVATRTGGRLIRIDPTLAASDQSAAIRSALEDLSFEARDNGGIVTSSEECSEPGNAIQRTVMIDAGSTKATFLISRRNVKDRLTLRIVDPSGATITTATSSSRVRAISPADQPYEAIQVRNPRSGAWKVVVRASASNARAAWFRVVVGVDNPEVGTALYPSDLSYHKGDDVRICLRAFAPQPLTGLHISASLRGPGIRSKALTFRDDGQLGDDVPDDGVYTAALTAPDRPGVYSVRAVVQSVAGRSKVGEADDLDDRRRARNRAVRSFRRVLETAFVVVKN